MLHNKPYYDNLNTFLHCNTKITLWFPNSVSTAISVLNCPSDQHSNTIFGGRLINEQGPLTVPQIALHRRVSRQAIQVMTDEYVNEGYLQFKDPPHHKRSKLVDLTPMGLDQLTKLSDIIFSQLDKTDQYFKKEDLITTVNVLAKLKYLLNEDETAPK